MEAMIRQAKILTVTVDYLPYYVLIIFLSTVL